MNKVLLPILLCLLSSLALAQEDCRLKGKWRSNEQMTVQDMKERGHVTEKQEQFLTHDFFGRFIQEFTCQEGRAYFAEDGFSDALWQPYVVKESGSDYLILEDPLGPNAFQQIKFVGSCFKIRIEALGFDEYFCKAE